MSDYTKPEIRTIHSDDILEGLGPVAAGSPAGLDIGIVGSRPGSTGSTTR